MYICIVINQQSNYKDKPFSKIEAIIYKYHLGMKTKDYEKPKFDISKAYDINEVAEVLGVTRRTIDRNNPNSIFSRSLKHLNKRYFEKDRVIEYQEKNILANIDLLLEEIESKIEYFDYNTEETIEIEYMNATIEVGVRITGFTGFENEKSIELVGIDEKRNRSYVDAYNKLYDELPKLSNELKYKVGLMVERINRYNKNDF